MSCEYDVDFCNEVCKHSESPEFDAQHSYYCPDIKHTQDIDPIFDVHCLIVLSFNMDCTAKINERLLHQF